MAVAQIKQLEDMLKDIRIDKPWKYNCEICNDSGFIVEFRDGLPHVTERCSCKTNAESEKTKRILDYVFGDKSIHQLRTNQRGIVDILKGSGRTSPWIHGKSGEGKSSMVKYWLSRTLDKFYATKGKDVEKLFRDQLPDGSYVKKQFSFMSYDMFAVDDIDKIWPLTDALKGKLYDILESVCESRLKLIFTANSSISDFCKHWPDHMSGSLARRLSEKCLEVNL